MAAPRGLVDLKVDGDSLRAVSRALAAEEDGKKLRRELTANLRKALDPAKSAVVSSLMSMSTHGGPEKGGGLRAAVAAQVKATARLSGRTPGVRLRVAKKGMPRGFVNAPKRLNRKAGWRHPRFGDCDVWVHQVGKPGWFDDTLKQGRDRYRVAVLKALDDMSTRIARKA
jgi:hypothetical protein